MHSSFVYTPHVYNVMYDAFLCNGLCVVLFSRCSSRSPLKIGEYVQDYYVPFSDLFNAFDKKLPG